MTDQPEGFASVAAAIRGGINDAYRLGLGAAIMVLLDHRNRNTDTAAFDDVIAELRMLSHHIGSSAQ